MTGPSHHGGTESTENGGNVGNGTRASLNRPAFLRALRVSVVKSFAVVLGVGSAFAGEAAPRTAERLAEETLPLRTALHHDPAMASPFEKLVSAYREADALGELKGLYRRHLAQFPGDARASAVLARVLAATGDPEAESFTRRAVEGHPADAYLRYLLYGARRAKGAPDSLAELERAIELETAPARKRAWIGEPVPEAVLEDRRELAEGRLRELASLAGGAPEGLLAAAREALRFEFCALALEELERAAAGEAAPETMVEIELSAASAEVGLDRMEEAASRLDRLLGKLTADYWRRPEILRRRAALVRTEAERRRTVAAARERLEARPDDEAACLDLAQTLESFEFRREALDVLLEGGKRLPGSMLVERKTLELLDRLRDERGRERYLAGRLGYDRAPSGPGSTAGERPRPAAAERRDLAALHVKSLYLLGRRREAREELEALAAGLDRDGRLAGLLEMARYLRRSSLPGDAAALFERAVELAPERLDVRRELAETFAAMGDPARARALFAGALPAEAAVENLLDLVQFMIRQELYPEARAALEARLGADETNLEMRTLLLTVHARLGRQLAGERLIRAGRELADTSARYRLWLEAASSFHESFETLDGFLGDERARLEQDLPQRGPEGGARWSQATIDRLLVYADVASRGGRFPGGAAAERKVAVATMLANVLEQRLAAPAEGGEAGPGAPDAVAATEARVKLRRRIVAALEEDEGQRFAVEQHLKTLAAEDPGRAEEYEARLALLYCKANRADLARPLLEDLDVASLGDAVLLNRLERLARPPAASPYRYPYGYPQAAWAGFPAVSSGKVLEILQRLTFLDPTNRGNWERWLEACAGAGNEDRLRAAIRRILAGAIRAPSSDVSEGIRKSREAEGPATSAGESPLSDDTRALLLAYLIDSYWRSVGELVSQGSESALADALSHLDAVERARSDRNQWLWANWARAYVLNRLDRLDERDRVLDELERVAAERPRRDDDEPRSAQSPGPAPPPASSAASDPPGAGEAGAVAEGIAFPDGLSTSTASARRLLTRGIGPVGPRFPFDRSGPVGELEVLWAFDTANGAVVTRMVELDWPRLAVADAAGTVYCLDVGTGKLLWEIAGAAPSPATGRQGWYTRYGSRSFHSPPLPAELATDRDGRLFVAGPGEVKCLSTKDGKLLWKAAVGRSAPVAASAPAPTRPSPSVFVHGGGVTACDPATGSVASFDPETGKLLSERELPGAPGEAGAHLNSGASLSSARLFVYGPKVAVLDLETGEVEWSFEPGRVRKFPLKLTGGAAAASSQTLSPFGSPSGFYGFPSGGSWGYSWSGGLGRRYGRYGTSRPQPRYVDHLSRGGASGWSPAGAHVGGTIYAAPAAAWAAEMAQERLGVLAGERLLLMSQGRMLILRLDLPLAAKAVSVSGTFAGLAGRVACFLRWRSLQLVDTATGETRNVPLDEIADAPAGDAGRGAGTVASSQAGRMQLAIEGTTVYVSGPGGIMCLNARTGHRLRVTPWPEGAFPRPASPLEGERSSARAPGGPGAHAMPFVVSGSFSSVSFASPPAAPQAATASYHLRGVSTGAGGQGMRVPVVDMLSGPVLLATPTASRVVALVVKMELDAEQGENEGE